LRPAFLRVYEYTLLVFEQFREDVASKPRQLEGSVGISIDEAAHEFARSHA